MKYLLDTNICIYYFKGLYQLDEKIRKKGIENCFISEITLAELKYGVANSINKRHNKKVLGNFLDNIQIIPIFNSLDLYAETKSELRKKGQIIDDFDLLIGASAISNKMVLITNNEKHFTRIKNIKIENWIK